MSELERLPKDHIVSQATAIELSLPVIFLEEQKVPDNYTKLPLSNLSSWGVAFEPITTAIQSVFSGSGSTTMLAKVTIPAGTHLAKFKNGSGFLGSSLNVNNQISGQAVINPLNCNPTMIFMAAALAGINRKLDNIQEVQKEILSFLIEKEKSELRGNLVFLLDILENYPFNWDNDKFINANHIKVLDIRQKAEQAIDFSQKQITQQLAKKTLLIIDNDVKAKLGKIRNELQNYLLSVYLYSFSSYLEIMLLGNFNQAFLSKIIDKINDYSFAYRELYTNVYNMIESDTKGSVQSLLMQGLSIAGKETGKALQKVPILNKSPLDEALISGGKTLSVIQKKQSRSTLQGLTDLKIDCVQPFIEQIKAVGKYHNEDFDIIIDKDSVFIPE